MPFSWFLLISKYIRFGRFETSRDISLFPLSESSVTEEGMSLTLTSLMLFSSKSSTLRLQQSATQMGI
jgi:hypothetical protein